MSNPVIVSAFWGDEQIGTYAKTLRDVAAIKRRRPLDYPQVVYVFGEDNHKRLLDHGVYWSVLASKEPVVRFTRCLQRNPTDRKNHVNFGITMWRHKLKAVCLALRDHGSAIWLDFDTIQVRRLGDELLQNLADGPPFQGRYRQMSRRLCGRRASQFDGKRRVWHGGCFYVRGREVIDEAICFMHDMIPTHSDEPALTMAVDSVLFDGQAQDPENYRKSGCDNPLLYSTHRNVIRKQNRPVSYFKEGRLWRS